MNVDELIAKWHVQREKDQEKFESLFPDTDDILAIVLRGHLMVEEYLDRLNRHCFHYPEYYDQAHLQFSKKLLIARAQVLHPRLDPTVFFDSIKKLNELRNNLAHNLDSPKLKDKSKEFLHLIEADYSESYKQRCDYKIATLEVRLRMAISYLLGQLTLLDNVIEFMEKSRHYGLSNGPVQSQEKTKNRKENFMNSKQFEDDDHKMWTTTINLGVDKGSYGVGSYDPTKPHLLVFTSDKSVTIKVKVGPEKSSIDKFSDEELKTLLKKAQQSKPNK